MVSHYTVFTIKTSSHVMRTGNPGNLRYCYVIKPTLIGAHFKKLLIRFQMMPKVKVTRSFKIRFVFQDLPEDFTKSPNNELYCNWWSCAVFCGKRLVESHQNTSNTKKHWTAVETTKLTYFANAFKEQ